MRVAQSKRNLLPGILINASGGTSANDIADILNNDYGIGSLGISFTTPIFNQGRLRSNVKLNKAIKEDAIQLLKLKLLKAFTEIEQLLYLDNSYTIQLDALKIAEQQSLDTYNLSKERYDKGLISLELVFNSQRQYNDSRSQFLVLKRQKLNNYLSLILALGGDIVQIDKNKKNNIEK
jgi:multidrug efflux system outer membrane protein